MPVTSVTTDAESLTMTIVADFGAPVRRLWDAYLDPRRLEQFWGPPTYPAVFTRHDGCVGGRSEYSMTGPDGAVSLGYWEWVAVDEPNGFEVRDAPAPPDQHVAAQAPGPVDAIERMIFVFEATPTGSRVTTTTHFTSADALEQLLAMGMEQGMTQALGQLDAVLADRASFPAGNGTATQLLGDTQVRISRVIRGGLDAVWRAHQEPALLRQWLIGPDGWTMPVCEVATEIGQGYRYEWAQADGEHQFGVSGTLLESLAPHRFVTTETMTGTEGPMSINELTLTPVEDGTLLCTLMTFADAETRTSAIGTGMTDGMEASYARLESLIS